MIDINYELQKVLKGMDCNLVFHYPRTFTEMPAVSYYTLSETGALYGDNEESVQSGVAQVDVWSREAMECTALSLDINTLLTAAGWTRLMSADVPDTDGKIYHKSMRFQKYFNV